MLHKTLYLLLLFFSVEALANDTVLKLYRPYGDVANQVVPQIKQTLQGACYSQSKLIVREDAWSCMVDGKTYDPCFVKAGANRRHALCPQSPWVGDSVQIRVQSPLDNEHNKTLDMSRTYPWAIELTNGERCHAVNSGETYDHMPVRYQCGKKNFLVGHLQRCKAIWSILEKTPSGVVTVEISTAWF